MDDFVPLRVAVAGSFGIEHLVKDPNRGVLFELHRGAPDLVILAGTNDVPRVPCRVIALHESARNEIFSGAADTHNSVYIVNDDGTRGALMLRGAGFPLAPLALDAREWGDIEMLEAYAALHRRWMIRAEWGPLMSRAIELLAAGNVQIVGDVAWIDGAPGPCRFGEAPRSCFEAESMVTRGIPRSCPFIG